MKGDPEKKNPAQNLDPDFKQICGIREPHTCENTFIYSHPTYYPYHPFSLIPPPSTLTPPAVNFSAEHRKLQKPVNPSQTSYSKTLQ